MKRFEVLIILVVLGVIGAWRSHAQQDDPRFTGRSDTMDAKDLGIGRRSFGGTSMSHAP